MFGADEGAARVVGGAGEGKGGAGAPPEVPLRPRCMGPNMQAERERRIRRRTPWPCAPPLFPPPALTLGGRQAQAIGCPVARAASQPAPQIMPHCAESVVYIIPGR